MINQELADFFMAYYNIDEDVTAADITVREVLRQVQAGLVPPASAAFNMSPEDLWQVNPAPAAPATPGGIPGATPVASAPKQGWWVILHDSVAAAIRAGAFTPQTLSQLTGGRAFASQQEVNQWMQDRWQAWFGGETQSAGQ